jgi:hypothetical protein
MVMWGSKAIEFSNHMRFIFNALIDDVLAKLGNLRWFSTLNLQSRF